jgi:UDP-N-acetylmuramoylalanine--D-glutamate ligase
MKGATVILGAGESGTGAALLANRQGLNAVVSEAGTILPSFRRELEQEGVSYEEGCHSPELVLNAREIIKSPGIPNHLPLLNEARRLSIPIISEVEFAGRYCSGYRICVSGSNGKTTSCHLIYHILQRAGKKVILCGNVGNSFAREVARNTADYWVIELSSFQLDGLFEFRTDTAVLLNITPDHLDRYENDFNRYAESKYHLSQLVKPDGHFIFNLDDTPIRRRTENAPPAARMYPFSLTQQVAGYGAWLEQDSREWKKSKMIIHTPPAPFAMTLENLALQGRHNVYNSMAASIAARLVDIRKESIKESLSDFQQIPHRLEWVGNVHGIQFINDSKATNVNAAWYALESIQQPVVWIAGGMDKGNDYSMLFDLVGKKVKAIICLGKDNQKIMAAFGDRVERLVETQSMEEAVITAYYLGAKGDVVLLSPACASFDLFQSYEDRGRQFSEAVSKL